MSYYPLCPPSCNNVNSTLSITSICCFGDKALCLSLRSITSAWCSAIRSARTWLSFSGKCRITCRILFFAKVPASRLHPSLSAYVHFRIFLPFFTAVLLFLPTTKHRQLYVRRREKMRLITTSIWLHSRQSTFLPRRLIFPLPKHWHCFTGNWFAIFISPSALNWIFANTQYPKRRKKGPAYLLRWDSKISGTVISVPRGLVQPRICKSAVWYMCNSSEFRVGWYSVVV